MRFRPRHALVVMACSPLGACGLFGPSAPSGTPIDVLEVNRATVCGTAGPDAQVTLFRSPAEVQAWEAASGRHVSGREVLAAAQYVLVENGQRSTGGYAVAVNRSAVIDNGVLTLVASFLNPQPGRMNIQMVTSPCALVALPQDAGDVREVRLIDAEGQRRAVGGPVNLAVAPAPADAPVR